MNIALDYDGTYTKAPQLWDLFISNCHSRGHTVYLVTSRRPSHPVAHNPTNQDVVYCGNELKKLVCERNGIFIDIWIDDNPGMIELCKVLPDDPDNEL